MKKSQIMALLGIGGPFIKFLSEVERGHLKNYSVILIFKEDTGFRPVAEFGLVPEIHGILE